MIKKTTARAFSNIALIKYWGKQDVSLNLPAVDSLSMTLDRFHTTTTLSPASENHDSISLDGQPLDSKTQKRLVDFINMFRKETGASGYLSVETVNNFPTAAGLASSASGFAALTTALNEAYGLQLPIAKQADLARRGSGSAPRSLFGGFATIKRTGEGDNVQVAVRQIAPPDHWNICLVVAVTTLSAKKVGSTEGMQRSRLTSPFYQAWIDSNRKLFDEAIIAVENRDFEKLGELTEASCFAMHGLIMSSQPAILYWNPVTIELINATWQLRDSGICCYATIDAGPHVKILALAKDSELVARRLQEVSEVKSVTINHPGPGAAVISEQEK
jgi:diphosphomevalonate decarboxylase